jgi:hypothetical protein
VTLQPPGAIIARVVEEPAPGENLADVVIGAVGLSGALILLALMVGLLLGAALVGYRVLRRRDALGGDASELNLSSGAPRRAPSSR